MNICYYCQHVLGVGHFYRSLEICKALAVEHRVTMITGGPEVPCHAEEIDFFKLPGLQMDSVFSRLISCDSRRPVDDVKEERIRILLDLFSTTVFDAFIVELYPFGRKGFSFELDPLLSSIRTNQSHRCLVVSSLRDILVEKEKKEKHEKRVISLLNRYFDGVLVHADEQLVSLRETFGFYDQIDIPISYTGFVSPPPPTVSADKLKSRLLVDGSKLIVVSIGGGNVGHELLEAVCEAARQDPSMANFKFRIFTGLYCPAALTAKLKQTCPSNVEVSDFSSHFMDWLAAADLSISMGGYNTTMNLLATGTPGLLYPFDQNSEQRSRAQKLAGFTNLSLIDRDDLHPPRLGEKILEKLNSPHKTHTINLDGSRRSVQQINKWVSESRKGQETKKL